MRGKGILGNYVIRREENEEWERKAKDAKKENKMWEIINRDRKKRKKGEQRN